jgi:nitric oxide reductase subunit C
MLILSVLFAGYTLAVYLFADPGQVSSSPNEKEQAGWAIWQERNCQSCHQLYGLGGYMGPDLTNAASIKGTEYMRSFIASGTDRMPNLHLKPDEVDQVISFLQWVDKSGTNRVPDSAVHWTGSYSITSR